MSLWHLILSLSFPGNFRIPFINPQTVSIVELCFFNLKGVLTRNREINPPRSDHCHQSDCTRAWFHLASDDPE